GWTDRELLVSLVKTLEYSNATLQYTEAACPPGRNANGFRQKINALKRNMKDEIEAIKAGNGNPVKSTPNKKAANGDGTPKSTPRKRKGKADGEENEGDASAKKRGRAKKNAAAEVLENVDEGVKVKDEPEGEDG
ncbi:hypothetical protein EK21DRAFT_36818, partial [Setomelanomma holmii]